MIYGVAIVNLVSIAPNRLGDSVFNRARAEIEETRLKRNHHQIRVLGAKITSQHRLALDGKYRLQFMSLSELWISTVRKLYFTYYVHVVRLLA